MYKRKRGAKCFCLSVKVSLIRFYQIKIIAYSCGFKLKFSVNQPGRPLRMPNRHYTDLPNGGIMTTLWHHYPKAIYIRGQ